MKSNIWTIIKKEFARFFGDRTMFFTTVIMPGLLIYIIYSVMGDTMTEDHFTVQSTEPTIVYTENMPQSVAPLFDSLPLVFVQTGFSPDTVLQRLGDKENNLAYLFFPPQFDSLTSAYDPSAEEPAPNIKVYYNSSNDGSMSAYSMITAVLDEYENSLCNRFDINNPADGDELFDQNDGGQMLADIISQLVPMLLLMLLFSGCMTVGPTSIAGEKERGTIATLLVTPMKRSQLAIGKIVALSVFALLGGLSSFLGIILSFPKMLHADEMNVDINIYGTVDYLFLLLILLSTVLALITVTANLSALAKDVKQASTFNLPLSLMMMVVGMLPLILGGAPENVAVYLIPFFNSVMAMASVMSHHASLIPVIVTVASNVVYAMLGVWCLTRLFNSERVMFGK